MPSRLSASARVKQVEIWVIDLEDRYSQNVESGSFERDRLRLIFLPLAKMNDHCHNPDTLREPLCPSTSIS
jgi:hypothetical protein